MKKQYNKPEIEILRFDYQDIITASNEQGHKYRLYTDMYFACRETPTDIWVDDPTEMNP